MKRVKGALCITLCAVIAILSSVIAFAEKRVVKEEEETAVEAVVTAEDKAALEKLPVEVKAKAVALMDVDTGTVLLEYKADEKMYPASVTKIMTMLLVAEAIDDKRISLSDTVSCSENAASKGGSQIWLEVGEAMTVDELLRATAIGSANDAATLLGEYVAGSETAFVDMMNKRAKELGMENTHFENATGLDDTAESHLTTARDIAIMSRELLKHDFITDYTTVWMDSLRNGETELVNTNKLVRFYDGTTGLKTGTTAKAGCCVSASAKRGELHLVAVVLGSSSSNDRFSTAKALLNWGFSNYSSVTPTIDKKELKKIPVVGGESDFVTPAAPEISSLLVKKGQEGEVGVKIKIADSLEAPIKTSDIIGKVEITVGKEKISEYEIYPGKSINELTFFGYIKTLITAIAV